jgi:hypothetical protein
MPTTLVSSQTDSAFICRCLAPVEFGDGLLVEGIEDKDWDRIIKFSDANYVSPALFLGLNRYGLFAHLGEGIQDYFEGIHALSAARNMHLKAQGVDLIRLLNSAKIEPVLLKGFANLIDDLYEDDGERIMRDIDVLIEEEELPKALKVLLENGYRYFQEPSVFDLDMKYKHEAPSLMAEGQPAAVELHIKPTILAGKRTLLDTAYARKGARTVNIDGAHALMPSPEFRLLHNYFNSQYHEGQSYRFASLHIRGLFDWVRLRQSFDADVNWQDLVGRVRRYHLYRSFSGYLLSAHEFFGQPIPEFVKPDRSARVHIWRQKLLLNHSRLAQLSNVGLYLLYGVLDFVSPAVLRRYYGEASVFAVMRFRVDQVMSSSWRKKKFEMVRRLVRGGSK